MSARAGYLETDSLISPRTERQHSQPAVQDRRCSPCKWIFYPIGVVASLGAIGVGIYNIALDPPQVMVTVAKYALPTLGGLLLASVAKNMGDLFKQKEVVVVDFTLEGQSGGNEIVIERQTMLRLIEQIARNNHIAIPNKPIQQTGASLNEAINERLGLINQILAKAGIILNNYATINQMLDQLLTAYHIQYSSVAQFSIDQQATIKLRMLEQALYQNAESSEM